ncbi:MAG: ABC transporter permease [Verrucomicrobium sp.]|nr:ABC transporter permease [Verrucomicrobium sp.]
MSRRFWSDPALAASAVLLVLLVLAAVAGPLLTGYRYDQTSAAQFQPPSAAHWFGTDLHGRDLLTRLLYGARISFLVGLVGAFVSLVIGVSYGAMAGYLGGRIDNFMMRVVDTLYALPSLIFVIVLIAALEQPVARLFSHASDPSLRAQVRLALLFIGLGCVEWLTMARVVRGQVLVIKELPFVQASRTLGQGPWQILIRHLLPNVLGIVLVYLTLSIPAVILQESFLSFLGLGVQAPAASLGSLMADGAQVINPLRVSWWLLVFPGLFMALTLLSLNFLGDGLRDLLDPRSIRR